MSDRLWLGEGRKEWADVNLCDHPSMAAAVRAFLSWQTLKISGPQEKIEECKRVWKRLEDEEEILQPWEDCVLFPSQG